MKKLIIIAVLALSACQGRESVDYRYPQIPDDIPKTTCSGTPVEWDWDLQRAYNEGRVTLMLDSTGCLLGIVKKIR